MEGGEVEEWVVGVVLEFHEIRAYGQQVDHEEAGNGADVAEDAGNLRVEDRDAQGNHDGEHGQEVEGEGADEVAFFVAGCVIFLGAEVLVD